MFTNAIQYFAACTGGNFLKFPTWYQYLPSEKLSDGTCNPKLNSINDVWLIVAAIIEILIRIAAIAAVGYIVYGGYQYQTSQGSPDKTSKARHTILNAIIGLVIAIMSATIVNFLARSIS